MRFACAEHPCHLGVGVCASCVREKLALCMRSLKEEGGGAPPTSCWDGSNMSSVVDSSPDIQKNATLYASHRSMNANGGRKSNRAEKEGQGRPLSWLSAKALCKLKGRPNILQVKPNSPNKQDHCTHYGFSPASLAAWVPTPCPSSASSKSPLKLASLHSTPSPASKLPCSTHATVSPLLLCTSQPSAAILSSPLQLPPPKSCCPARRSPFSLAQRSPLPPAIASLESSRTHMALSAEEQNRRNGQRVSGAGLRHLKRKVSWVSLMLRKLRLIKRRAQNQEEMDSAQLADSNRTSSATESDLLHHSHAHYNSYSAWNRACGHRRPNNYSCNLQIDRPQKETWKEDMKSMRGYANCYTTSQGLSSFSGLRARHGYKSMSCVQRRDAAELLRFYLPPPSFYSTLTRSYYC